MKYLRFIKITSIGIAIGIASFKVFRNLNNIENRYSNYIFWIAIFIYFASSMWIDIEIKKRNRLKK
ncbi:hypothetical protein [Clostridium baratii]|uniref:hypothetical protein n=1 Tax=Clostridium baratii TaxID=1561 RepID=UPI0030D2F78C